MFLLRQKFFLRLWEVRVCNAAIDRADRCTLRLFMETDALGAFVGHDVVERIMQRSIRLAEQRPVLTAFVDSGIWTFGFASTAVDALFGDH